MKEQTQFQSRPSGGHHHGVYLTDSHFRWNKLNKPQFLELGDMGPDTSMNPAEQCTHDYTCMIIATTANWTGNKLVSQACKLYLTFNNNYLANAGSINISPQDNLIVEASGSQGSRQSMAVITWPFESKDSRTEVNDLGWEDEHLHENPMIHQGKFPHFF